MHQLSCPCGGARLQVPPAVGSIWTATLNYALVPIPASLPLLAAVRARTWLRAGLRRLPRQRQVLHLRQMRQVYRTGQSRPVHAARLRRRVWRGLHQVLLACRQHLEEGLHGVRRGLRADQNRLLQEALTPGAASLLAHMTPHLPGLRSPN